MVILGTPPKRKFFQSRHTLFLYYLGIVNKLVYICLQHNIEPRIWTPIAVAEAFIQTCKKFHFI